jgi:6-pyruvoyltetrahydropterin/6-carboxytetrahydropterin synthase
MYTLVKHFWISCAHYVPGAGKCERVHGHNFKVTFCIQGDQLDDLDMLVNFIQVKHLIEERFDHHILNDFPEFNPNEGGYLPTTERIAEVFFNMIDKLCRKKKNNPTAQWVEVQETDEAYVRYERIDKEKVGNQ